MYIGLGIVLIVIGAILAFALNIDIPGVGDDTLGYILMIAGVLAIEAVIMFDKLKVDDPVGATAVHLVNGVFGTICVGLFGVEGLGGLPKGGLFTGGGAEQLIIQLKGVAAAGAFTPRA